MAQVEWDDLKTEAREMHRIESRSIGIRRQRMVCQNRKWIKRSGTSYGQRGGRCAKSRVDELVWGRQRVVCQNRTNGLRGVVRVVGRGQGDGPNQGSIIGIGGHKMVFQNRRMDQKEWDELWAEAREMGRIEG